MFTCIDYVQSTGYMLTSCGAKGRMGPHQNQCTNAYQDSVTQVQVLSQGRLSGVQVWTAPTTGLYTSVYFTFFLLLL